MCRLSPPVALAGLTQSLGRFFDPVYKPARQRATIGMKMGEILEGV
ncbi:hypothetical protein SBA3_1630010 [Candidatus Sulfopaludibacter sp. SbA3]|nr:hypothetical protein SBA3_1630010 [Candidatus Sulfopaludibacter sp. SbA3]